MAGQKHEKRRVPSRILALGAIVGLMVVMLATTAVAAIATLDPKFIGSTNPGFANVGDCPAPPADAVGDWGWHFNLQGGDSTFNSGSAQFANAGNVTLVVDGKHAYAFTGPNDTIQGGTADITGDDPFFNLSHVCTGTTGDPGDPGDPGVPGGGGTTDVGSASATAPDPVTSVPRTTG